MLERRSAVAATAELLAAVRSGRGRSLFVVAEAGLGKTTVLEEARRRAGSGVAVGMGRGDPMETSLPFGLLAQALDALGAREVLSLAPSAARGDARAAQFYGVQRWLEARSAGPVLLLLDDLHWSDPDSLALLSFLCRRLAVGVLGTLRPWPPEAHGVASELAQGGCAAIEELAPLSEAAAGELLGARLGQPVEASVATRAWSACAGNPLLLEQVAAALEAGEDVSALGPASAHQLVLTRFGGLSPPAMAVARAAAIFGTTFSPDLAAAVAEVSATDDALDALWRSRLFRSQGDAVMAFVHPLFCQALYEDLGPIRRASLHARAYECLVARGRRSEAAEHAMRAHLVGDLAAVAVLEGVGRAAQRSGALAAAATYLGAGVELAGDRASPGLRLALATVVLPLGRLPEAMALAEGVVAAPQAAPAERVAALGLWGRALTIAGSPDQAAVRFDQAVALAEAEDPALAVEVLLDYALASWLTSGPVKSVPLTMRARRMATRLDPNLRLRAEVAWGHMALEAGDASGVESLVAAGDVLEADALSNLAEAQGAWGALENVAFVLGIVERFEDADRLLGVAKATATRVGSVEAMAMLSTVHAYFLMRIGRLGEALESMEVVRTLAELSPMFALYVPVGCASILQHLGRLAEADAYYEQAKVTVLRSGILNAHLFLWEMRGHRHLLEGRPAKACEHYARIEALGAQMGMGNPCIPPWAGHAITTQLAAGNDAEASRLVGWLEERAAPLPARWPRIAAAVGRAALAERAGNCPAAEAGYETALGLHAEVTLPLDHIETLTAYGGFLRRSGQPGRARAVLAQAVGVAEDVGAAWLGGYAHRELAVAGGRRRARREPRCLTPQEQRVAELAASGASNAEIAAQLVVSVATVETHLSHLYAKLGIRSRRQVAGALSATPGYPLNIKGTPDAGGRPGP